MIKSIFNCGIIDACFTQIIHTVLLLAWVTCQSPLLVLGGQTVSAFVGISVALSRLMSDLVVASMLVLLFAIFAMYLTRRFHHMPVLNDKGKVVGVNARSAAMRSMLSEIRTRKQNSFCRIRSKIIL